MKNLEKYSPYVLALLRIIAAYMFILHGTAKFWEFPVSMTGGNGAVDDPLMIVGGIIEIVGFILFFSVLLFCVCWCRRVFSRQPQTLINYLINLLPAFCGLFFNQLNKSHTFKCGLPVKFFLYKRKRLRYNSSRLFLTI